MSDSTFTGNNSTSEGYGAGGILVDSGTRPSTAAPSTTTAASGSPAAIIDEANLSVTNSTFVDDTTPTYGGAIQNEAGTADITSSTFYDNEADFGGAGIWQQSGATLDISASILADSTSGQDRGEVSSTITDLGYNLDDDAVTPVHRRPG